MVKIKIMDKLYSIHESNDSMLNPRLLSILEQHRHLLVELLDYFALLMHSLMIETGFEVTNQDWKRSSSYSFQYKIRGNELNYCSLNVHKIGPVTTAIG